MPEKGSDDFLKLTNPLIEWKLGTILGTGTFGEVYTATNSTGAEAAAKVCKIESEEDYIDMKQESKILTMCTHINVLKAIISYYYDEKIWMMLELCSGGALDKIIEKINGIDERTIKAMAFQCLHGLEYLHRRGIIHRDIKAANIMLTEKGICKIADFGVSAVCTKQSNRRNTFIGTPYWMAPEVFLTETSPGRFYDEKCDIFSLGITIIEAESGFPPHSENHPAQMFIIRIRSPVPTFRNPDQWSEALKKFVAMTLTKEFQFRPSATQCLDLDYFKHMDINDNEPLIELYNIRMAFDQGVEEEIFPDEEVDSEDTSSVIINESNFEVNKQELRTIKRTIKYKIDGVDKQRTIIKVVDSNNIDEKDQKKENLDRMLNQRNRLQHEERRQLKKLETAQQADLQELITRYKSELDRAIEKYKSESENQAKWLHKDVEKKKATFKLDIEKTIKNTKYTLEKERKTHTAALKTKNTKKFSPCYYKQNYIEECLHNSCESLGELVEKHSQEFSNYYTILVNNKNDKLIEILKILILDALRNSQHVFCVQRAQIHAKMDLVVQLRFKINEKETASSLKFLSDKLDQLFREQERARRELPKQQRGVLKKEMDAYKKKIKKSRYKNEKELINKRNQELIQVFESEIDAQKKQHEDERNDMEESNAKQMRDMYDYQDIHNSAIQRNFQDLLYQQYVEEESAMKNNLIRMHCLIKTREQEFEMEIQAAKTTKIDGYTNINPTMF